eukprot:TRINITY_DN1263_c0_g3_i1.p1 TRINITY_DN1263_c0_g3~~TRINITY_DN1263_c0_g3_i1.p1  ORF type:complete len:381 (-),score=104.21 TRINITY_DN1263_c0_g3_i1:48-1145(-)
MHCTRAPPDDNNSNNNNNNNNNDLRPILMPLPPLPPPLRTPPTQMPLLHASRAASPPPSLLSMMMTPIGLVPNPSPYLSHAFVQLQQLQQQQPRSPVESPLSMLSRQLPLQQQMTLGPGVQLMPLVVPPAPATPVTGAKRRASSASARKTGSKAKPKVQQFDATAAAAAAMATTIAPAAALVETPGRRKVPAHKDFASTGHWQPSSATPYVSGGAPTSGRKRKSAGYEVSVASTPLAVRGRKAPRTMPTSPTPKGPSRYGPSQSEAEWEAMQLEDEIIAVEREVARLSEQRSRALRCAAVPLAPSPRFADVPPLSICQADTFLQSFYDCVLGCAFADEQPANDEGLAVMPSPPRFLVDPRSPIKL